jgi:hypothetical protein
MEAAVYLAKRMAAASLATTESFDKPFDMASRPTTAVAWALNCTPKSSVYNKHSPTVRERLPSESIEYSAPSFHPASRGGPRAL